MFVLCSTVAIDILNELHGSRMPYNSRMKSVCVFCGSSLGVAPEYDIAAKSLGAALAKQKITLVYGGSHMGLMGSVANAALAAGGEVVGVIPRSMAERELAHQSLTQLVVVESMHERKAMMNDLADGFIAMPGGLGTLEEMAEVLTWAQLGIHHKPCAFLNTRGYYDHMRAFFDHAVAEGFMKQLHAELPLVGGDPVSLLAQMRNYLPRHTEKFLRKG